MTDGIEKTRTRNFISGAAVVTLIGGLWTVFQSSPAFAHNVCLEWVSKAPAQKLGMCNGDDNQVTTAQATDLIDHYLVEERKDPDYAWATMLPSYRSRNSKVARIKDGYKVAWNERTSEVAPSMTGPNEFTLTYRSFRTTNQGNARFSSPAGIVDEYRIRVLIMNTDQGMRMDILRVSRMNGGTTRFPWANLNVDTQTYSRPDVSSDPVSVDSRAGQGYRVLCTLSQTDGTVWYRTYLGWLQSADAEALTGPDEYTCHQPWPEVPYA